MERLFELNVARGLARKMVHKIWKENNLDCILTLPAPHTAVPFDKWSAVTYTCIFNYLDYPAFVLPVGRVQMSDVKDGEAKFGEIDAKVYSMCEFTFAEKAWPWLMYIQIRDRGILQMHQLQYS